MSENRFHGVVGQRAVHLLEKPDDILYRVVARGPEAAAEDDHAALREYFMLHLSLSDLNADWSKRDEYFRLIAPHFQGARLLQQDPLECLFQFICSSNNHIGRIHTLVDKLCMYGTPLTQVVADVKADPEASGSALAGKGNADDEVYYAFPTMEQLRRLDDEKLREAGFGYRAEYITSTAAALYDDGGRWWLLQLRNKFSYLSAKSALMKYRGVGPKVAACVCLFSLDKFSAVPVDTHVWNMAQMTYTPWMSGKKPTPKRMDEVEGVISKKFGDYAGWAQTILFISDLQPYQRYLPRWLTYGQGRKRLRELADGSNPRQQAAAAPQRAIEPSESKAPKRSLSQMQAAALQPHAGEDTQELVSEEASSCCSNTLLP